MLESTTQIRARAKALVTAERDLLQQLIQVRKDHGLSQAQVAERMAVSQSAVSQFERYDANPTLAAVRRYALAVEARLAFGVVSDRDFVQAAPVPTGDVAPRSAPRVPVAVSVNWTEAQLLHA